MCNTSTCGQIIKFLSQERIPDTGIHSCHCKLIPVIETKFLSEEQHENHRGGGDLSQEQNKYNRNKIPAPRKFLAKEENYCKTDKIPVIGENIILHQQNL